MMIIRALLCPALYARVLAMIMGIATAQGIPLAAAMDGIATPPFVCL